MENKTGLSLDAGGEPEQLVNPDLNILTHYDQVLEAMASIEGSRWKELQLNPTDDRKFTLSQALNFVKKVGADSGSTFTVYGGGGINRWYIRADGSVEFSARHAYKEKDITNAKVLGFKIYS